MLPNFSSDSESPWSKTPRHKFSWDILEKKVLLKKMKIFKKKKFAKKNKAPPSTNANWPFSDVVFCALSSESSFRFEGSWDNRFTGKLPEKWRKNRLFTDFTSFYIFFNTTIRCASLNYISKHHRRFHLATFNLAENSQSVSLCIVLEFLVFTNFELNNFRLEFRVNCKFDRDKWLQLFSEVQSRCSCE